MQDADAEGQLMGDQLFSTTYEGLPGGSTKVTVATAEQGQVFSMTLSREETIKNLQAWARSAGLIVSVPL